MSGRKTEYVDISIDLKYTNKEHLTVDEIITALKSAEKLIYRTKPFIEEVSGDGYRLERIEVYVEDIKSGSFFEKFKARLFFGSEENEKKAAEGLAQLIENTNMKTLIPLAIGALATYGVMQSTQPGQPSLNIQGNNNVVISSFGAVNMEPEVVKDILEKTTDKKGLSKEATQFISPAKKDPDAQIEIGNVGSRKQPIVTINKQAIAETPEKYEPPKPSKKEETYQNVIIDVVALDVDKPEKWEGTISDVVESRAKITFADDIDVNTLSRVKIKADVEVVSVLKKNKYHPTEIYVEKVHKNN